MSSPTPGDLAAICTTLYRYATGIDTRDWALYRSIFDDEVEIDMSSFNRIPGRRLAADTWVEQVTELMCGLDATQHVMTNPIVEVDGDEAVCTMYVQAEHMLGEQWYTLGGYYTDRLRRHGRGWLITAVRLTVQWRRGTPAVLTRTLPRGSGSATEGP